MKNNKLRIGILGSGTIGGYVLDAVKSKKIENAEVVVVCGRTNQSRGREKVEEHNAYWTTDANELLNHDIDVVVESASHDALRDYGSKILNAGVNLIPLSLGALVDKKVLDSLINSAERGKSLLHIPSGGIGGLDALQSAVITGVDEVKMITRKPPEAWKEITYVDEMNIDLDNVHEPILLYKGSAKDCVKKFPQNINIAAILSLAGTGFDSTIIEIWADPNVSYNTHKIIFNGKSGKFQMTLENEPVPSNPRTTYMACLSAVATLKRIGANYRIGT